MRVTPPGVQIPLLPPRKAAFGPLFCVAEGEGRQKLRGAREAKPKLCRGDPFRGVGRIPLLPPSSPQGAFCSRAGVFLPCLHLTPAFSAALRGSAASVTELAPLCKLLISKRANSTPCCLQECVSQPLPTKSCFAIFCGSPDLLQIPPLLFWRKGRTRRTPAGCLAEVET